ncbi:MAG: hypothetical protein L0Y61_06960 [Epsilonproteobacteria bacterium]|nr:hypothetical protein [Campylobacterota bacterium]
MKEKHTQKINKENKKGKAHTTHMLHAQSFKRFPLPGLEWLSASIFFYKFISLS